MSAEPLRIGLLSTAHGHAWSYVGALKTHQQAKLEGIWDEDAARGEAFAKQSEVPIFKDREDLLSAVDAVVIASANNHHKELIVAAAKAGKHILCEKPLVARAEDFPDVESAIAASHVRLMTAFPCRFSPAYQRLKAKVNRGDLGTIKAICATNRGRCPFDWFVQKELSGGGAMIDHVVHVADLLRDLLGHEPLRVTAKTGNNVYGQEWEDTAMLTLEYPDGIFATLDSSWSRPATFKTWGDVTMTVVGDKGIIELDMFGAGLDVYGSNFSLAGFGSDLDALMINAFISSCIDNSEPPVTMADGLAAVRVALAGYQSVESGQPVELAA